MIRFYITFILILIQIVVFSKRPTQGVYYFTNPLSYPAPIWKQKSYYPYLEKKYTNNDEKRTYLELQYFDQNGYLSKIDFGILNKKQSKLKEGSVTKVKYDTIIRYQVFITKSLDYYAYDSVHFHIDGYKDYHHSYTLKIQKGRVDTVELSYGKLVFDSANIKKYLEGDILYTYHNNKPIRSEGGYYQDSISYKNFNNSTVVNYYYKKETDSIFYIGKVDSLSNGLLIYEHHYEKYFPSFNYKTLYFYNENNMLILKFNSQFSTYEIFDYSDTKSIKKEVFMRNNYTSITNYIYRTKLPYKIKIIK
jgi:hypothetical protein